MIMYSSHSGDSLLTAFICSVYIVDGLSDGVDGILPITLSRKLK